MANQNDSIFNGFTNLYSLTKTLKFELRPEPKTRKFLKLNEEESEKHFPEDKEKAHNYQKIKYYIDILHKDFITETLSKFKQKQENVDFENNNIDHLRKKITKKFQNNKEKSKEWFDYSPEKLAFLKKDNNKKEEKYQSLVAFPKKDSIAGVLFSKHILDVLIALFSQSNNKIFYLEKEIDNINKDNNINFINTKGEDDTIFKNFKGFSTYFSNFHENRKNLYKSDGKAGRIVTRIVDENLPRFKENIKQFEDMRGNFPEILEYFGEKWNDYFREKEIINKQGIVEFKNSNCNWSQCFEIDFYNHCLIQNDIETYNYIIKKLNKNINEFKQKLQSQNKKDKSEKNIKKLKTFKELHKQILGEVKRRSDFIEINTENIVKNLKDFIEHSNSKKKESENIMETFKEQEDYSQIYLSSRAINTISSRWFISWQFFGEKILDKLNKDLAESKKKKKCDDFVSLEVIKKVLEEINEMKKEDIFKKDYLENKDLSLDSSQHWYNFLKIWKYEFDNLCAEYEKTKETLQDALPQFENLEVFSDEQKNIIKNFADNSLNIYQMTKYFAVMKGNKNIEDAKFPKDSDFYNLVDGCLLGLGDYEENKIYLYYNALRNFLTKKPWNEEKIKLNFECGHLLDGFSKQHKAYLFKKEKKFYLGLSMKGEINNQKEVHNVSEYQYFPGTQLKFENVINKSFPGIYKYKYSEQKNEQKAINDAKEFIKNRHVKKYPLLESIITQSFTSKKDFREKVEQKLKEIYANNAFVNVDYFEIEEKITKGDLYIFEIYNKDFSRYAKHSPEKEDIHTKFFKLLFKEENLDNPVLKLSGGGEIFFREKTEKDKLGYRKNSEQKDLTFIDKRDHNKTKKVVKNRRYSENKLFLHLPIELNFGRPEYENVNQLVNTMLLDDNIIKKIKIIGIDRGEKHLAYYSVIDMNGNIFDQGSFNRIYEYDENENIITDPKKLRPEKQVIKIEEGGKIVDYKLEETRKKVPYTDYKVLLDYKEKKRLIERQSWNTIESIKELKQGYISHVVNQITKLIFKHLEEDHIFPIVVFENLNTGFKQSRQKIEKQIYQKLELQLAQKLNYLVKKGRNNSEYGSFLKALQLSPKVNNFSEIEKASQFGTIFYVDPSYTSTTCPQCGFRKRLLKTQYESIKQAKEKFFNVKKDDKGSIIEILEPKIFIKYEFNKYSFTFVTIQVDKNTGEKNEFKDIVYSNVERLYWDRGSKKMEKIEDVTLQLNDILGDYKYGSMNESIKNINDAEFWKKLIWCLNLILQIRNSENKKVFWDSKTEEVKEEGEDRDFIQCPHCHFHSENKKTWKSFDKKFNKSKFGEVEFNGDANGAYNIGRKWLIQLKNIQKHHCDLRNFKQKWNIKEDFPKEKEKGTLNINGKIFELRLKDGKYIVTEKNKSKKENIEIKENSISKYPDLFISNLKWDKWLKKKNQA